VPNPPLPSGAMILYLPRVWPLKSKAVNAGYDRETRINAEWCDNHPRRVVRSITRMRSKSSHADRRFLAAELGGPGQQAVLAADEAHHLTRVLRLGPGDRVAVFDGRGREFIAQVVRASRDGVVVTLLEPVEPAAEPRVPFSVVQAVLKGPAMEGVVRDATMVGAGAIEPVISSHVVVKASIVSRAGTLERWRRIALTSAKQCRRAVIPEVRAPRPFTDWLASAGHELRLILVEPSAETATLSFRKLMERRAPASAALIVGPEGGWDRQEIEAALASGCVPVSLGTLTLRADAVALAAGAVFRSVWED
jgi:16S rRNA (uracil1498-N3)-methyltransferase